MSQIAALPPLYVQPPPMVSPAVQKAQDESSKLSPHEIEKISSQLKQMQAECKELERHLQIGLGQAMETGESLSQDRVLQLGLDFLKNHDTGLDRILTQMERVQEQRGTLLQALELVEQSQNSRGEVPAGALSDELRQRLTALEPSVASLPQEGMIPASEVHKLREQLIRRESHCTSLTDSQRLQLNSMLMTRHEMVQLVMQILHKIDELIKMIAQMSAR